MPEQTQKILFVMNPIAGGKNKGDWEKSIREYFRNSIHRCEIFTTSGENDETSLRYWIKEWKPDKVASVGGDGTLRLVAEVLENTKIPVSIFPAGSSNGMARELLITPDFEACMNTLLEGNAKPMDVIRVNDDHLCLHLSDIGLNAHLVKYFQENDLRGKWGYAKEIFRVLWRRRLMQIEIRRNDELMVCKAFMIVIANAGTYGTGARINPIGNLHDGLFEVVILRKLSLAELLKMLIFHRPFNPKKTEVLQSDDVVVKVKRKAYFQIDGEYMGKTNRVTAKVEKGALMMMFPKGNQ